jgi:CRP-like cAMP-binding protein
LVPQRPLEPLIRNLETESQLGDDEREAVRQLPFTVRNIPAGGDIVRERENPSQCCLVLEGWLCRHKITLGGARQIFSFHIAGDIPDLQSLHLKTMDHSLSSVTASIVAFIQHDDLKALDAAFPRLGDILWRNTLIDAAIFREWINGMGRREARVRLAHLLCELFVRMRAVGLTKGNSCQFPLTQSVLGDALGLSTVHINRSLMELRGLGLIILEKHGLTIPNLEKLEEYASFDPLYLHMEHVQNP